MGEIGLYIRPEFMALKLTGNALLILAEIDQLSGKNGYCWAQNKHFEDRFNLSDKTVRSALKKLTEIGKITKKRGRIYCNFTAGEITAQAVTFTAEPPVIIPVRPVRVTASPVKITGPSEQEIEQEKKKETSLGVASPAPVVNVAPEKKKKPKAEKTDNQAYWDELLFMLLEYFHLEWGANHRACNTWRSQRPTAATFVAFRRWRREVTESMLRSGRSREMVDSINTMLGSDAWKLDRPKLEAEAMRVAPEKIKQVEAEVADRLARKYPDRFQTHPELIAK